MLEHAAGCHGAQIMLALTHLCKCLPLECRPSHHALHANRDFLTARGAFCQWSYILRPSLSYNTYLMDTWDCCWFTNLLTIKISSACFEEANNLLSVIQSLMKCLIVLWCHCQLCCAPTKCMVEVLQCKICKIFI